MKSKHVEFFQVLASRHTMTGPWLTIFIGRTDKVREYRNITNASAQRVARALVAWQADNPQLERMRTKAAIRKWEELQP